RAGRGPQMGAERQVPRVLVNEITDVLELAESRRGELQARELAVDAVEDADDESEHEARRDVTRREEPGDGGGERQREAGDLVRRDRRRGERANEEILE